MSDDAATTSRAAREHESGFGMDEPLFKYEQVRGEVAPAFDKDMASALAATDSMIAVGMHSGVLYVFKADFTLLRRQRPHAATIFDLKIDSQCQYVACASMDGKISVLSLTSSESYIHDLRRPVRSIALEPNFSKKNAHQFISGGMAGLLILHERGWLGQKERTLHTGDGPIWNIEWADRLVAWASDAGVRIMDVASQQRLAFIPRSAEDPRPDLFRCNLHWIGESRLFIGWADTVKIVSFQHQSSPPAAEVTDILQLDCAVSGVGAQGGEIIVLGCPLDEDDNAESEAHHINAPELRLVSTQGEELLSDTLEVDTSRRIRSRDLHLRPFETGYLVLTPTGLLAARRRSVPERIAWLAEHRRFLEAMELARNSDTANEKALADIGRAYLLDLTAQGLVSEAARQAPRVLGEDAKAWEDWIFFLAEKGHLQDIALQIPTERPRLSGLAYEVSLLHLLRADPEMMLRTIGTWPRELYDVPALIAAAEDRWAREKSTPLLRCLAELYLLAHQHAKALPFLLALRDRRVFDYIRNYNLFTDVRDSALALMRLDEASPTENNAHGGTGIAVRLLVEHTFSIPVPRVVAQLKEDAFLLYKYLDALFDYDPTLTGDYADLLVALYAEHAPDRLIEFMRASTSFNLEKAYQVCSSRGFIREMVFLQSKMGNNKRALHLIIDHLGNPEEAIAFTKEQNDVELWDDLLTYAESRPHFIKALLDNVGSEVDPIRLVRRIRNGLHITGLKKALIGLLQDYNLQLALVGGCHKIAVHENRRSSSRLHSRLTRGVFAACGPTQAKMKLALRDPMQC